MKKYSAIFAAVLAMAACEKVSEPSVITTEGAETRFVCSADTRISVGDKVGSTWNALWTAGDELTIVKVADNSTLGTATLVSGEGQHSGVFATTASIDDGTSVRLVYGAASIKSAQVQAAPGAKDLSDVTYAESAAFPFTAGSTMNFTLSHSPAIVHVTVSSTDFADLQLTDVSLFSPTAALADDVTDRVGVSFTAPEALSGSQEAWFVTKPVTVATDFYVVATMKGTYSGTPGTTVQIPVKFEGKTLQAGKVNSITIAANLAENDVDWYNPVCTRYIPVEGWCYGTANTIMVPTVENSTIDFDIRAQGDFCNIMRFAKAPTKLVCILPDWINTGSGAETWQVDGSAASKNVKISLADYTPTIGRFTGAIANSKSSVTGFMHLLDAEENVIWRYTLWATAYGERTYANGTVMDRNLGSYDPYATSEHLTTIGQSAANVQLGPYAQWGRPFMFNGRSAGQGFTALDAITSLALSAGNAGNFAGTSKGKYWYNDCHDLDLWGNNETSYSSTGGQKSVFDPCPKGWKVVSPAILSEVVDGFNTSTVWKTTPVKGFYYTYNEVENCWPVTKFYNYNATSFSLGSAKACYFSDASASIVNAVYMEGASDGSSLTVKTANKAQGAAIRCMKDTANR